MLKDLLTRYLGIDPDNEGALKSSVPIGFTGQGSIWYANTAPAGWLICDGSSVERVKYPDLWNLLGSTWGLPPPALSGTHFKLPDMRQRVPVGKDATGTFNALNNAGGAETHTLTIAETPVHSHSMNAYPSGNEAAGYQLSTAGNGFADRALVNTAGGSSTNNTGNGNAHNNLQPYRVVNFIIKT